MKLDVLAIGAHPDDVELGCGGTVALLARQGRRVGILHLTRGERGTRGTADERRAEAEQAAAALGAVELAFLDAGDGGLRTGLAEEDALIAVLRAFQPDLVLGPTPSDRHPDHGRAHRLVEDACFYAGLAHRGSGAPHRPAASFSYMQHDSFEPSFVVDVTADWETKLRALAAYRTQLFQPGVPAGGAGGAGGPVTKVSTEDFWRMTEGRARHFGALVGASFGEPFWYRLPLAVSDPLLLLPGGVR
ncbi:MAG TPA: bacillithiol biosynthesis deacetylase BshB1 [Thermoanaerobaculia bacterium]|nr:bacillithiol biosynthesis deacetylase BshB1 [Thermoanaerobaculia bacterium]